jgi:tape measure domain-containing protein|nr:MAG TPA: tail tape measure [Caudoviricetes sp.]
MAESYSVKATLSATDKGFSSTLNKALGATEKLASNIGSFKFGILTGVGQKAFSTLTSGVSGLISEMNSSNAAWKTFEGNMQILGKSEGEINSVKKTLQKFAEQSIYSSSDMAQTYAQLESVGVKSADKLVTGFGGLAAAAENPQQAMKTLSQQATQMAAKPTVAWQDFKLMLEQTPAGLSAVAKQMGMTTSELVTSVQEGKVKTTDFFKAIDEVGNSESFSKLATEAKTMGQAMDGLKETVSNKLSPAFDVLSQAGIKAIDKIASKLGKIDGKALAVKIQSVIDTIGDFITIAKREFSGVGSAISSALKTIGEALGITNGQFSKRDAMIAFRNVCKTVATAIKNVCTWINKNKAVLSKVLPIVAKVAGAFLAFKVVNSVAPGLTSFVGGLAKLAGKGIAGIAMKLFGIAAGTKAAGAAGQASSSGIMQSALASLALGGAVLLAAAGLALLAYSAIKIAEAGWPAVAALVGLVAIMALLAIGAAVLGASLTAGAVGFLAFGGAIALCGLGAVLAGAGLAIIASILPTLVSYGLQGAVAILALGGALLIFGAGALVAGAGALVLGAGLLVVGAAVVIIAAGFLVLSVAIMAAAVGLTMFGAVLPVLAANGAQGALALVALGAALVVFGAGALVGGAGAMVLGAGLLVVGAAVLMIATGFMILATATVVAGVGLNMIAAVLPILAANGAQGALALTVLGAAFLVFGAGALVAGAGAMVLSVGLAAIGIALAAIGAGLLVMSIGGAAAAGAIALLTLVFPGLIAISGQALVALLEL